VSAHTSATPCAQHPHEFPAGEAAMPDLDRVPQRPRRIRLYPIPSVQLCVMAARQRRACLGVMRQQRQERRHPFRIKPKTGRKLP
jgi:hypothetical protein